ncbi:hypothetical protein [Streptomyces sp. NPDC001642]|uniref:LexA family protein n=1 Tax=Streptomyces sp. NPDC001642 TaxID=3154392 RepID=UPI00331C9865
MPGNPITNDVLPTPQASPASEATAAPQVDGTAPVRELRLTGRQLRILQFLRQSTEVRGYPPSLREIGHAVGLRSTSSITYQLKQLKSKGLVTTDPNRRRSYVVVGDPKGPQLPPPHHTGCPLLAADNTENPTSPLVLRVDLDATTTRALLSGALLTVRQRPLPESTGTPGDETDVVGQVTAISHPLIGYDS